MAPLSELSKLRESVEECGVILADEEIQCDHKHNGTFGKLNQIRLLLPALEQRERELRVPSVEQVKEALDGALDYETIDNQILAEQVTAALRAALNPTEGK